jgi:thiol-disulfide isomerase/thioredoxin
MFSSSLLFTNFEFNISLSKHKVGKILFNFDMKYIFIVLGHIQRAAKTKKLYKMASTPSNMLPLGTIAPEFSLMDTVTDKNVTLQDLKGDKGTVIMFICNHCPFVKHVNPEISKLGEEYQKNGIGFIAISSNDVENYPQDAPDLMKETAKQEGYSFPYLYDETQEIAKAYDAACTPDFYLFDDNLQLVYRGQLDDSRPGNGIPLTGKDLRNAMDSVLEGKKIDTFQKPSIGCNIKWADN